MSLATQVAGGPASDPAPVLTSASDLASQPVQALEGYTVIEFFYDRGVGTIRLNAPDRLNSFNSAMREDLGRGIAFLQARDDLRGVILTGNGRGFCAGQDLTERKSLAEGEIRDLGAGLDANYRPLITGLRALPVPVLALVNGVAAGAGVSLALACDVIIALESAKFIQAFTKIGLVADAGGTYFMPRLIGTARAMGASLFAEPITARQALDWGMIWKVVPDAEREQTLIDYRERLASGATRAYAATKRAIHASAGNNFDQQFALECELQTQLGHTADYVEGVRAFAEKRAAQFQGR